MFVLYIYKLMYQLLIVINIACAEMVRCTKPGVVPHWTIAVFSIERTVLSDHHDPIWRSTAGIYISSKLYQ